MIFISPHHADITLLNVALFVDFSIRNIKLYLISVVVMQTSHNGYSSILYIELFFLQENILRAVWQGSGHYRRDHPEATIDYVTCGY